MFVCPWCWWFCGRPVVTRCGGCIFHCVSVSGKPHTVEKHRHRYAGVPSDCARDTGCAQPGRCTARPQPVDAGAARGCSGGADAQRHRHYDAGAVREYMTRQKAERRRQKETEQRANVQRQVDRQQVMQDLACRQKLALLLTPKTSAQKVWCRPNHFHIIMPGCVVCDFWRLFHLTGMWIGFGFSGQANLLDYLISLCVILLHGNVVVGLHFCCVCLFFSSSLPCLSSPFNNT